MKTNCFTILSLVFMCFQASLQAQEPRNMWVLDSMETGTKTYIARESVSLLAGFKYSSSAGSTFSAAIDPMLLFPPTDNSHLTPDGDITSDPALGGVVGAISGSFDVSQTGAAIYSVPIEVLPGIQDMQPKLSLVYNSQSGIGIAGMCWNLSGLSMISRVPKNYYHDNDRTGIIWDNTSPLALDGQRLIRVGIYGSDSIEYRTESGLDRIVGYTIKSWGPLTFKVYTKDGKILEYGNPAMINSYFPIRLNNTNIESANTVYHLGWALTRVIDVNNNFVDYTYHSDATNSSGYYNYNNVRATSISYGNHTGTTKETVGRADILYTERTHPYVIYIDGMETSNKYLLDKIQVRGVNNLLTDTYEMSYTAQDDNDFLLQIKKVNASGEFILPLQFEWSSMNYSYSYKHDIEYGPTGTLATPHLASSFFPEYYGDIDGDGFTDVLVQAQETFAVNSPSHWIVYRNNGNNSYQCLLDHIYDPAYEKTFLFLDLDGTGDKLYVGRSRKEGALYGYYLDCYKYQNGNFSADVVGNIRIPIDANIYNDNNVRSRLRVVATDFKGEGTPQFLLLKNHNAMVSHLGLDGINLNTFGGDQNSGIFLSDINGNGKTEIAYREEDDITFYEYVTGRGFVSIYSTTQIKHDAEIHAGDFNGDGNTDLLVKTNSSPKVWKAFISTGTNFIEHDLSSCLTWEDDQKIIILDVNQDGKSDIFLETPNGVYVAHEPSTSTLKLLISNGNNFIEKTLNTEALSTFGAYHTVSNFTPGHSKDIMLPMNTRGGMYGSPHIISLCNDIRFNKISKIKDSFGQQLAFTYQDHKNPYAASQKMMDKIDNAGEQTGEQTVINNSLPQLEVITTITTSNTNQSYEYAYPRTHRQAKGFLGFSFMKTTDNIRSLITEAEYSLNSTYHFLYPFRKTVKTTGGAVVSETSSVYTVAGAGTGRYYLKQDSLISTDALKGVTIKTSYSNYDGERNPRMIRTDYGSGISSTEALTYISAGSRFLNKIASRQRTQQVTGLANVTRKEYFSYDAKGNQTYHVIDSTDVNKVQTFYGNYDKYGNPGKITTVANGVTRSQTLTHTASGRLVKTKRNDQLGETVTYDYEPLRLLLTSETDRVGTTSYEYDRSGRLKFTIRPDGIRTAHAVQWAGTLPGKPANAKFYSYTETSGQSPVWVWYDAQGREVRRDMYGLNRNKVMVETEYNDKGELYRVSEPYFENMAKTYAATYAYDSFGRNSKMVTPMGTTTYTYSGLTTTVTSPTGTNKTTVNPAGWVVEEETNGKSVYFTHYASGQVKTATPQDGQSINMEYDLQGNRKRLTDPDAGIITTQYDGWGQLVSHAEKVHLTGNSVVTTYNYHPSGLLNYRLRNGETTAYGYDYQNRLQSVSIAGKHVQNFEYDRYDRIIQSTNTVEGSKVFTSQTEYDQLGRISKETYPGGYYIMNRYDSYGYLTVITDMNGSNIWTALTSNAKGQLTSVSQGGRTTSYGFDTRGFPTSINCPGILEMNYSFTSAGNLDYRSDYISLGIERFTYDSMNRLTGWKTGTATYHPTTGLMSGKSDLGGSSVMYYGEDGQPPHALTSITGSSGQIPSAEQGITYTDFKKALQITEGDHVLDITYGVGDQRIKTELSNLSNPSGTLIRYYAGNYEEEIRDGQTRQIHYINGGNGLAALYVQNNGRDTLYYTHIDYQGSLLALSLTNGTVIERYAYDPWGKRRNPMNWSQLDTRKSFITDRGYTMHEHLPEFNLINMNGRVYDPLVAQFLSLDPYVQAPGNWLNYNRYAYAYNNPLIYTDPDGEWIQIVIGAAIGGIVNWFANGADFSWKGLGHFGVGAAAGALGGLAGNAVSSAVASGGFVSGALSGAAGGAASGFVSSAGNTWMNGGSFTDGFESGFIGAGIGGLSGGLTGGLYRGIADYRNGYSFWNGHRIEPVMISDYDKIAKTYNQNSAFNDEILQDMMYDEFDVKVGDFNIKKITTQAGKGVGLTENGTYYLKESSTYAGGYLRYSTSGFSELHISPKYVVSNDIVSFRAIAGHELIHAYHHSLYGKNFNLLFSERVAYRYTYNTYFNSGRYMEAFNYFDIMLKKSYWGNYPANYHIPPVFKFY